MKYKRYILLIVFSIGLTFSSISQVAKKNNTKVQYLLVSSGLMFPKSKVSDPFSLLESGYTESFAIRVTFQKQLRKRLYWETSLSYNEYWIGYRINDGNPIFLGAFTKSFGSIENSYNLNYNFQTNKNKDIINLHFGFFFGYAFASIGTNGKVGYINSFDQQNIINQLEGMVIQPSLLVLGNLFGISRDFRVTKKLDIGLNFNYNFGYNTLRKIDIEYTTSSSTDINNAQSIINGTSWQSFIYLKYRISDTSELPKDYAHNNK